MCVFESAPFQYYAFRIFKCDAAVIVRTYELYAIVMVLLLSYSRMVDANLEMDSPMCLNGEDFFVRFM